MLTMNEASLALRAERLRNHGAMVAEEVRHRGLKPYELPDFEDAGYNFRMTDIQAAVGVVQLGSLDAFIAARATLAGAYDKALASLQWITPPVRPAGYGHALQSYVARVSPDAPIARDDILARLHEAGIGARPGTHSVVGLSVYRERLGTNPRDYPRSTALQGETLALPLHNHMTDTDVARVVEVLEKMQ